MTRIMLLDQLVHWRLRGRPDVFRETKDGHEWLTISHGNPYNAGFLQQVTLAQSIQSATLTTVASLYTTGGLMLRMGIDPTGQTDPAGKTIAWCGWLGPSNGWPGDAKRLHFSLDKLNTDAATIFLQATTGDWPTKANIARYRNMCLEIEYTEPEQPEPEPVPEEIRVLQKAMEMARKLLDQAEVLLEAVRVVQELFGVDFPTAEEMADAQRVADRITG